MRTYSDSQDLRTWMYFCSLNLKTQMHLYTESLPLRLVKRGYRQQSEWQQMLARMRRKRNPYSLLMEVKMGISTMEMSGSVPESLL